MMARAQAKVGLISPTYSDANDFNPNLRPSLSITTAVKMPILSTLLHATPFKSAFLSTLVPTIGLAYVIQTAFAIPAVIAQTERYYDLSGSLTYLSCTLLS